MSITERKVSIGLGAFFLVMVLCAVVLAGCDNDVKNKDVVSGQAVTSAAVEADMQEKKAETDTQEIKTDEEHMYVSFADVENEIDTMMVPHINDAGNNSSEAALRENENIFYLAWKIAYDRLLDHLLRTLKKDDKTTLKKMDKYLKSSIKYLRRAAEQVLTGGQPGNGTWGRLNLMEGETYRQTCLTFLKMMDPTENYRIHFNQMTYDALKSLINNDNVEKPYYGIWLVKGLTGTGYVSSSSYIESEKESLGGIIIIAEDCLYECFPNEKEAYKQFWEPEKLVQNPKYKEKTIDDSDMISMRRIPLRNLDIKSDTTKRIMVKTEDDSYPFEDFIVKDKNHLIINGTSCFLAERVDNVYVRDV